jgi:osmoprotectant transport system substrate-binding protein
LYPEYTGTALTAVLKLAPSSDPAAVLERVRAEYRKRWHLEWLDPLGFDNTFAMVVRGPDARAQGIETITTPRAANRAGPWEWAMNSCSVPTALPACCRPTTCRWRAPPKSMDLGLLYSALEQKQVDMAAANATDGMLSVLDVKVLRDDRHYFPPYQAAVIVRAESLAAHPGLRAALDQLAGKLSAAAMRDLNHQVDGKHRPVAEVAREWLATVRCGGVRSGFSLACFSNSSNFFSSTLPCDFSVSNCFRKTSSRRPASPFSLATAAARSSIGGGFTGTAWAITTRVSGSIFRTALQQGQSTSNNACGIVPIVALRHAQVRAPHVTYKPSESKCEDLEGFRGFDRGDWLEGNQTGKQSLLAGLALCVSRPCTEQSPHQTATPLFPIP